MLAAARCNLRCLGSPQRSSLHLARTFDSIPARIHKRTSSSATNPSLATAEAWIQTDRGRLFSKKWMARNRKSDVPFLLIHDSLGSVALWRGLPEQLSLATGRDVIAYDRLGFGLSDRRTDLVSKNFVAEEASQYVKLVLKEHGAESFLALGHSIGGSMAVYAAHEHSQACKALITESAVMMVEQHTLKGVGEARIHMNQPEQLAKLRKYHQGEKAKWVLDAWVETWLHPDYADWQIRDVSIHCPYLILHGEIDEFGTILQPQTLQKFAKNHSQLSILPGMHHVPHKQDEALIIRLIAQFLENHQVE